MKLEDNPSSSSDNQDFEDNPSSNEDVKQKTNVDLEIARIKMEGKLKVAEKRAAVERERITKEAEVIKLKVDTIYQINTTMMETTRDDHCRRIEFLHSLLKEHHSDEKARQAAVEKLSQPIKVDSDSAVNAISHINEKIGGNDQKEDQM